MNLEQRVAALEQAQKGNQRDLNRLPLYCWPAQPNTYDLGFVGGGNSISPAGYTGIKKIATYMTTVPSAYDPTTFPSTIDGIGWGWHFRLSRWVLMLNDARSGIAHDIPNNAPVFIPSNPVRLDLVSAYVIALT